MDRGLLSAARDSLGKAIDYFKSAGSDGGLGGAEELLGDIDGSVASFDKAFDHYAAATRLFRSAGDKVGVRAVTLSVMDLYSRMGLEEEAFARGEEALRLAQVSNDRASIDEMTKALIPLCRTLGRREIEEQLCKRLSCEADSLGDKKRGSWVIDQEGLSAFVHGDGVSAGEKFEKAIDLMEQTGDTARAIPEIVHLGRAYESIGNFPEAISAYLGAMPLSERSRADRIIQQELLFRLGNALLVAKRNGEAVGYFQSALSLSKKLGDEFARRYALLQLANTLRSVDLSSTTPIVRQALDGLDENAPPSLVAYAYGTEGLCALARNSPIDALSSFQRAVEAMERQWRHDGDDLYGDCQRVVTGPTSTPWHDEAVDLLLRMGKNDEALGFALRRDATILFRKLARVRPAVEIESLQGLLDRWHASLARCTGAEDQFQHSWSNAAGAKERAAAVANVLAENAMEIRSLGADIVTSRKTLASFVSKRSPSVAALQQLLPEGTRLILYGTTTRSLQIFVVSKQTVVAHSVTTVRTQLTGRCTELMDQLSMLSRKVDSLTEYQPKQVGRTVSDLSSGLYEIFVRPIEKDLRQARSILLAEDGNLPFVPVGSFRRSGIPGTSLLEQYPTAYVLPSMMTGSNVKDPIVNDVIAFGSPGTSGRDAEYELRDIKVSFKDARFLFDPGATLAVLSKDHADLAHLTLDVHWDASRPSNSFVTMLDPSSGVMKPQPIGAFVEMPAFPAVVLHNLSREATQAAGTLGSIPFGAGSRVVVLNCAGTGRKSTKGFVDAFSIEVHSAKGVGEAYRAALLGIIRKPDSLPSSWMSFVLWNN